MLDPFRFPLVRSMSLVAMCLAVLGAASARANDSTHAPDQAPAEESATATDSGQATIPDDIDWSQLNSDIAALPGKTRRARGSSGKTADSHADWTRSNNDDGSSALSVRQSLFPFWDTKVGVDMSVASPAPTTSYEVLTRKLEGTDPYAQSGGSAWAGMTAPGVGTIWDKTTFEARINPSADQTVFGTAISKSLPFGGDRYSLSMQSGYNLIQQGHTPLAGITGGATSNLAIDNSAKLDVLGTGTSLIAGQTLSTADDRWLSHIGAEQKLFGGVSVTGSISETAEGYAERSLKAGYKYRW
ncbi:hypothetical protein ACSVBT_18065 [Afipia sp. TerB]